MKKKLLNIFFILVIFFPIMMKVYFMFTNSTESQLKGYYTLYEKPKFNGISFWNTDFQDEFIQYWDNNFSGRIYMLKCYNEIRYSLYKLGSSIIGENNTVYPEFSLNDMFCINKEDDFNILENQIMLENYITQLENVKAKLKRRGIELIVYTTPNKAYYDPENVPYRYKVQRDEQKVRAYECFKTLMNDRDFYFIDSNDIISLDYPVFYSTGVHWSRTAEQEVTVAIINRLKEYVNIAGIELGDVMESEEPFWRDTDGWDMLNIIRPYETQFYEYEEKIIWNDTKYIPTILIQGGSYSEGLREDVLNNGIGIVNYINYKNAYWNSNGEYMPITEWTDLPMEDLLKTDVVVIELNESVIKNCSNGFVDFLDRYL